MIEFKYNTWLNFPKNAELLENGKIRVSRNITQTSDCDGNIYYQGESADMTDIQYAAYLGAKEVAMKRENEIIDEYTMELIEEGVIS